MHSHAPTPWHVLPPKSRNAFTCGNIPVLKCFDMWHHPCPEMYLNLSPFPALVYWNMSASPVLKCTELCHLSVLKRIYRFHHTSSEMHWHVSASQHENVFTCVNSPVLKCTDVCHLSYLPNAFIVVTIPVLKCIDMFHHADTWQCISVLGRDHVLSVGS